MISVPQNINEEKRLSTLRSYNILDTPAEIEFDNLTQLASEICETPISLINFVDETRVWCKSKYGLEVDDAPREDTFCTHVIDFKSGVFVVPNSKKDQRFKNNPYVVNSPNIVFYASFPLSNKDGITLGNLCVIDSIPRELSPLQLNALKALAKQAMHVLEHHKSKNTQKELEEKNIALERFAYIAAHDLKAPLNNIHAMSCLLTDLYLNKLDDDGNTIINHIKSSSTKLKELIDGVLEYSKNTSILKNSKTHINIANLEKEFNELFGFDKSVILTIESELNSIHINKSALNQILLNLIENAIKYNDKVIVKIKIGISQTNEKYEFYVQDNGPGITAEQQERIFDIFQIFANKDKYGHVGNGIGLATVKKLIEQMGGQISIKSVEGNGSKFIFNVSKD